MNKQNVVYIQTMEYYVAIRRNEVLTHATTQMALENIMLIESQTKKGHILYMFTYMKYPE